MGVRVDVAKRCWGSDRLEGVSADAQHSGWTAVPSLNGWRVGHRDPVVLWDVHMEASELRRDFSWRRDLGVMEATEVGDVTQDPVWGRENQG